MPFLEKVYRLINLYNQKMKKPRRYGTDDLLYPAEVHLLEVIGASGGISTTQLAQRLSVTKGAVSQTAAKLLEKGLLVKKPVPGQQREQLLTISEKGGIVFQYHRNLHSHLLEQVESILAQLPEESRTALEKLLATLEETVTETEENNNALS